MLLELSCKEIISGLLRICLSRAVRMKAKLSQDWEGHCEISVRTFLSRSWALNRKRKLGREQGAGA